MVAKWLRGIGQTLITLGVVILLFVVYELYITGLETARSQHHLQSELTQEWGGPLRFDPNGNFIDPSLGSGIARIWIPRFAPRWSKVVVEGVNVADLKKGPGHYPRTALPGQEGNLVISGHRTTYGAPFNRIEEIQDHDMIVVETATFWYSYQVDGHEVVRPSQVDVIDSDPSWPHTATKLLTLTSCHPKYSASRRYVVFGHLMSSLPKSAGLPPALKATA